MYPPTSLKKIIEAEIKKYLPHVKNVNHWDGSVKASNLLDPAYRAKEDCIDNIAETIKSHILSTARWFKVDSQVRNLVSDWHNPEFKFLTCTAEGVVQEAYVSFNFAEATWNNMKGEVIHPVLVAPIEFKELLLTPEFSKAISNGSKSQSNEDGRKYLPKNLLCCGILDLNHIQSDKNVVDSVLLDEFLAQLVTLEGVAPATLEALGLKDSPVTGDADELALFLQQWLARKPSGHLINVEMTLPITSNEGGVRLKTWLYGQTLDDCYAEAEKWMMTVKDKMFKFIQE